MKKAFLILVILIFVGCSTIQEGSDSQSSITQVSATPSRTVMPTEITPTVVTQTPTAIDMSTPTPKPTNTKTPTATPTLTPSPTATLEAVCPSAGSPEEFADFQNSAELQESILAYLNQGGQFTELRNILESLIVPEYDVEILQDMVEADLNGDGVMEILITVDTFQDVEDHGRFLVLQCLGGEYYPVYVNMTGLFSHMPHPIAVVDLDGDSSDEIVIEHEIIRSAWGWAVSVFDWQDNDVINILTDPNQAILGGGNWELKDEDEDGLQEFVITGHTISHTESGLPREIIETFGLQDGQTYTLLSTEYLPPEYRHHALEDAQRSLDEGDFLLALSFYDLAAHDDDLKNIGSYHLGYFDNSSDSPNEYQRAFALFRMLIMQILLEDEEGVLTTIEELDTKYPEDSVGGEFTVLAHTFQNDIEQGKSVGEACQTVTIAIRKTFPELELHIGYWGYRNVSYENETICLFNSDE